MITNDALQRDMIPRQTRDGFPVVMGPGILPGPADTYIAYGRGWANTSNTPFREYKHWVHEGGISTPLIVHWPQQIKSHGELRRQPGHLIDIMATCVDAADAEYPQRRNEIDIQPIEGVSLLPACSDNAELAREAIYWEHEGNRAIRAGKWKLVAKENRPWELYDMNADRAEARDLAAERPELVAKLDAQWTRWAERANVLPLGSWRGKPKADGKSTKLNRQQTRFELPADADLPRDRAPMIENRPFAVEVTLDRPLADGVLIAQGGSAEGFSLYARDGKLIFATRRGGKLQQIESNEPIDADVRAIQVRLDAKGYVTLAANKQSVAHGKVGLLSAMPLDGLQVGRDETGAVGEYEAPNASKSKIVKVLLELL
ncbi:MAG: sulfatase-like hydrolase/transferase [Planctomycetales bacterium]|nr:sulfatase-like hydrolase/transferase [Planctomycetales bacterium]